MMNSIKKMVGPLKPLGQSGVLAAKRLWHGRRGEPIRLGPHLLRYEPGTRPVRLKYVEHPDPTTRNDARQLKYFLDRVCPSDFVLDIGGHKGQYAVLFGALVGRAGRVVTFEPDEAARSALKRNLARNALSRRVRVEEIALSDTGGTHAFFSRGGDSMSSLARSGLGSNAHSEDVAEQVVRTMRLDDYLTSHQMGFPRWIKLDTEGAEVSILRGAREVLKSGATIVCELHPYVWDEFGTSFEELLQIVHECGRSIKYLDESHKIEDGALYGAAIIS